ncbi:MAG: SDR family NAD(P)-dependent oxidoreductase [Candidatus Eisenbacteria bacterium]|nr:SDR family NAD(P)-dependent oxidoreductase [Candidatus Eisenbacteria bacterium]
MTPLAEKNQVVLLTGATRGIGRATALSYAAAGARLVLNYAANDHALDSLLQEAALPDDRLIVVKGLVQDPQVSRHMVRAALARWGRIDHLINNAGAIRDVPMALMQASTWDEILAVNLDSVFHCCKHASRPMVAARRGSVVNVSSLTATRGRLGQTHHGAAKAGVLGLTRSLSHELGRYNVR